MIIMVGLAIIAWVLMAIFEPKGNSNIDDVYKHMSEKDYDN